MRRRSGSSSSASGASDSSILYQEAEYQAAQADRARRGADARRRREEQEQERGIPDLADILGQPPGSWAAAAASGDSSVAVSEEDPMVADGWMSAPQEGGRHRRHGPHREYVRPAAADQPALPNPVNRWDEVEAVRARLASATTQPFAAEWEARVVAEHEEVNHPQYGRGAWR